MKKNNPRNHGFRAITPTSQRRQHRKLTGYLMGMGAVMALGLIGCKSHSISIGDPSYRGDLSEYQVLNSTVTGTVSEADIQRALLGGSEGTVRVPAGSRVLLVQSGASTPDPALVSAMRQRFDVVSFSGLPPNSKDNQNEPDAQYAKKMRLAAAQAGCRHIVCVWGLVDSNSEALPTKVVSWTPIVGGWIPDERRVSRIRLRAAVIDTASGRWSMKDGEPFHSQRFAGNERRRASATWQQEALKNNAYPELVTLLAGR